MFFNSFLLEFYNKNLTKIDESVLKLIKWFLTD